MNRLVIRALERLRRHHGVQFAFCTLGLLVVFHLAAIGAPAFVGLCGGSTAIAILIVRLRGRLNAVSGWRTFGDVLGDAGLAFLGGLLALLLTSAFTQWNRPELYDGGLPWRVSRAAPIQGQGTLTRHAPEPTVAGAQATNASSAAGQPSRLPPDATIEPDKVDSRIEERLNKLGAMFEWLLAVLALALAVMTWLVGKAAKDAKEEAAAVRRELNVLGHIELHELSICMHRASVEILFQLGKLDRDNDHRERYVLGQFWSILAKGNGIGESAFDPAAYQQTVEGAVLITECALAGKAGFDRSAALFPLMRRTTEKLLDAMHKQFVVAARPSGADCVAALRSLLRLLD